MDKIKTNVQESFSFWCNSPQWASAYSFTRFLDHTQDTQQSVGLLWTDDQPDTETYTWQAHKTRSRQTSMPPVGFKPTNTLGEQPAGLRLRPRGHWHRQRPGVTGVQMSNTWASPAHTNNVIWLFTVVSWLRGLVTSCGGPGSVTGQSMLDSRRVKWKWYKFLVDTSVFLCHRFTNTPQPCACLSPKPCVSESEIIYK